MSSFSPASSASDSPVACSITSSDSPIAAKVQPHALSLQCERRYLRRRILKVPDLPVRRKHYVQKIYQHFLVPPVPEHGLEPRIRKDVYILPGALSFTPALFLLPHFSFSI